jgi:hypothetical protein
MSENLNDIFTDESNETPINAPTTGAEDGAITVEIVNSANKNRRNFTLYPENTLREVLEACKSQLALTSSGNQINFEYNGVTYSDPSLTVEKIGLVDGSKLLVHPSGMVAATIIG